MSYKARNGQSILDVMLQNKGGLTGLNEFINEITDLTASFDGGEDLSISKEINDVTKLLDRKETIVATIQTEVIDIPAFDFKTALSADGVNDHVTLGGTFSGISIFPLSVNLWANRKTLNPDSVPNTLWSSAISSSTFIRLFFDNKGGSELRLNCSLRDGGGTQYFANGIVLNENANIDAWVNVGVTIEESPDLSSDIRVRVYYNGVNVSEVVIGNYRDMPKNDVPTNLLDTFNALFTSLFSATPTELSDSRMDEFIILSRFLTDSDMLSAYNSGLGSDFLTGEYSADIEAHYRMDESGVVGGGNNTGLSNTIDDETGTHDGTLVNFDKTGTGSNWVDH